MKREKNKKKVYILVVVFLCVTVSLVGIAPKKEGTQILDKDGEVFATVYFKDGQLQYDCREKDFAYAQLVMKEADGIRKKEGKSAKEVHREINRGLKVCTYYDPAISKEMQDGFADTKEVLSGGMVLMNTKGRVLACYSTAGENHILEKKYVASTMKPLSVYGPGIEKNIITWSSLFIDAPLKQIKNDEGNYVDWPQSNQYTGTMKTVQNAVAVSHNATALRVLEKMDMNEELRYLSQELGFNVEPEKKMVKAQGVDSVLSHVALGYLTEGESVLDMTARYQIFADGGVYYAPYSISKIQKKNQTIYQHSHNAGKKVLSEDTAYIVNRLLKSVVEKGGTGERAEIKEMEVCGKTGTTEENQDNWFIGFTPDYVCGVWHGRAEGTSKDKNRTSDIFKIVIKNREEEYNKEFQMPENVVKETYCLQSGKLASDFCGERSEGFYKKNVLAERCDI